MRERPELRFYFDQLTVDCDAMQRLLATVALIGVTAVWGWTFVMVRDAVAVYGVVAFLALRFTVATVAIAPFWGRRLNRQTLRVGLGIGIVLAAGYLLQTWGLRFTTATNSGLITGLFVVLAPIADRLINGTRLPRTSAAAVLLSVIGMVLLTGRAPTSLAIGDLLTLGCAVAFGVHIALLSRYAPRYDAGALTAAQMISVAAVFALAWPATEPFTAPPLQVWHVIVITGLLASALGYYIQTAAQRHLSAARTAVILTLEPVFAGMFGFVLAGERLRALQWLGAALILSALLVAEVLPALSAHRR